MRIEVSRCVEMAEEQRLLQCGFRTPRRSLRRKQSGLCKLIEQSPLWLVFAGLTPVVYSDLLFTTAPSLKECGVATVTAVLLSYRSAKHHPFR